jgi:hypothetical protein
MGKRTARGQTAKSQAAVFSKNLLHLGLLRGFASKIGREDIEEKYSKAIVAMLGESK